MYELKTDNNTIHLKWGTWAMKRFCELENKNLMQLIEVLSGGVYDLDTIVHNVCEWIDQVGGLSAKDGQLVEFMRYMQDSMTPDLKPEKGTDEKKN